MKISRVTRGSLLPLGFAVLASDALAANIALEEIIVTATKRETSLMETAGSISAFDGDAFDLLGIEGSDDLTGRTPSLTIGTFRVAIRGIGRPNLAVGAEPGVGLYWDGVYNTENGLFNYSRFMDIERIEVLRGPQGTLYGRNSIGGAISFISKKPAADWTGRVTGELSNYDGRLLQGYASGPVTDKLGVLVGVSKYKREGFQDNTFNGKDYDKDDTLYGTFGLEHQTTDNWVTNLKVIGVDRGYRSGAGYILEPFNRDAMVNVSDQDTDAVLPLNLPGMFPAQNFVNMRQNLAVSNPALRDEDKVRIDRDPDLRNDRYAAFLSSEYTGESYSLKYTGGYSRYWFDTLSDADHSVAGDSGIDWRTLDFAGIPVSALTGQTITPSDMTYEVNQEADSLSHELQYSSDWDGDIQVLGGLYYYHSNEEQVVMFKEHNDDLMEVYAFFAGALNFAVSDNNFLYRGEANVDTTSYAAYGQARWDWTQDTQFSAGLRLSYDEKKGNDNTFVQYVGDPDDPTVFREEEDEWDEVTYRLAVDHALNDDHFIYGFVATGYRSGGFNFNKPTSSSLVDTVEPESLVSYELGYKGSLWENRATVELSAYYYDYEDLQVITSDVVEGIALNTFVNADQATAWGIEFAGTALVNQHVLLSGTYSWNDSEYDEFLTKDATACQLGPFQEGHTQDPLCTDEQDLEGNQFPLMPEHKASANVTFMWNLADLDWSLTTSYLYTGKSWSQAFNNPDYDRIDSYDVWNARISVTDAEKVWKVEGFVRNIEDDRDIVSNSRPSTVTDNGTVGIQNPRVMGVSLEYNF